ncbi:MAG: UpxY family transcription antiterminator [Candidatus Marinimicrobia bacterium]|jgi:transcription antitermination factor NusG|nr:UpxY family transcription antiterminator [Candidatus Neomarinimicrobiota bacterium]
MNSTAEKKPAELYKSVPTGKNKNGRHWYAVYTKPRHEKKVDELLREQKIECYLPLVSQEHHWTQRKKEVEVPLIRGYVFVRIQLEQMLYVLQTYGVVRFVMFSKELAVVPDFQIEALKRFLEGGFTLAPINYMQIGQLVEVIDGPLKGVIGKIQNINNQDKFVLALDAVQAAYTIQVDPLILAPLPPEKKKKIFTLPLGF